MNAHHISQTECLEIEWIGDRGILEQWNDILGSGDCMGPGTDTAVTASRSSKSLKKEECSWAREEAARGCLEKGYI